MDNKNNYEKTFAVLGTILLGVGKVLVSILMGVVTVVGWILEALVFFIPMFFLGLIAGSALSGGHCHYDD